MTVDSNVDAVRLSTSEVEASSARARATSARKETGAVKRICEGVESDKIKNLGSEAYKRDDVLTCHLW